MASAGVLPTLARRLQGGEWRRPRLAAPPGARQMKAHRLAAVELADDNVLGRGSGFAVDLHDRLQGVGLSAVVVA